MSKLKDFKKNAVKVGQSVVATAMLTSGLMNYHPEVVQEQPKPQITQAAKELNEKKMHEFEMMWLDEDNIIINGEILSNEDAIAKYPNRANTIRQFVDYNLRHLNDDETEAILNHPENFTSKTLTPEAMQEIEQRMQNFDINDYLDKPQNADVTALKNWINKNDERNKPLNEPTMER